MHPIADVGRSGIFLKTISFKYTRSSRITSVPACRHLVSLETLVLDKSQFYCDTARYRMLLETISNPALASVVAGAVCAGPEVLVGVNVIIKWKHFPRYWPFVRGIHWSPVNSRTKASDAELLYFLWSAHWTNGWANNREAGDLWRHRAYYDVIVMLSWVAVLKVNVNLLISRGLFKNAFEFKNP